MRVGAGNLISEKEFNNNSSTRFLVLISEKSKSTLNSNCDCLLISLHSAQFRILLFLAPIKPSIEYPKEKFKYLKNFNFF